jgi:hypothetical protein
MKWKISFVVGAAAGYVLGARAGRQRYEQLAEAARRARRHPVVRDATLRARQTAGLAAGRAVGAVTDRVGDRLPDAITDRVAVFGRGRQEDDSWGTVRH